MCGVPNVYKSVNKQMESLPLIAMFLFSNLLIKANILLFFFYIAFELMLVWAFFSRTNSTYTIGIVYQYNKMRIWCKKKTQCRKILLHETDSQT